MMKYAENAVHQVGFICKHYKHAYVKSPSILDSCEPKLSARKYVSFIDIHDTAKH